MGGRCGVDMAVLAQRQDLRDFHVVEAASLFGQRAEQGRWFANPGRHDDEVVVSHMAHRLGGRGELLLV
jgi:hypothetical protein